MAVESWLAGMLVSHVSVSPSCGASHTSILRRLGSSGRPAVREQRERRGVGGGPGRSAGVWVDR
eukprot:4757973-Prymnesium_polylepis.1